jgi:hypothetical protein
MNMNKLVFSLAALCGCAGIAVNSFCMQGSQPNGSGGMNGGEKSLKCYMQTDTSVFDFYNPILEQLCKESPDTKPECWILLNLARSVINPQGLPSTGNVLSMDACNPLYHKLLAAKLLHSNGTLKPEIVPLVLSSFSLQKTTGWFYDGPWELKYKSPLT